VEEAIPTGRVAFYISPEDGEIHYSVVRVKGRYADDYEVIELPRGEPDDFYVNHSLAETNPHYRIVVERSKEQNAVKKLGIQENGDPLAILSAHGYEYERTENLEEAGGRELKEEHGFDSASYPGMAHQLITMRPFSVKANYGSSVEYRSFLQIEGDIEKIKLQKTDKIEKKAPKRLGVPYTEEGSWASLREMRKNAADFMALAEAESGPDAERLKGEAVYQTSIADWMESAEAALVGILRGQRISINTTSVIDPTKAVRTTGAAIAKGIDVVR
jgi:hypothetical protein